MCGDKPQTYNGACSSLSFANNTWTAMFDEYWLWWQFVSHANNQWPWATILNAKNMRIYCMHGNVILLWPQSSFFFEWGVRHEESFISCCFNAISRWLYLSTIKLTKNTTQQRNWKSYIRIFWAYTIIQLSKTSKKIEHGKD